MTSEEEVVQDLTKKIRTIWFSLIFFGVLTIVGFFSENFLLIICGLLFVVGGIFALFKFHRMSDGVVAEYLPGKGFGFYRKSRKAKLKHYTYAQIIIVGLICLSIVLKTGIGHALSFGIAGILYIQFFLIRRVSLHTTIDDATLFELEELGIISSSDIVKALYKDFVSWNEVVAGNKIIVVKQDSLLCLVMQNKEEALRYECPLREIQKLGIMGNGNKGDGFLITIVTRDDRTLRILLDGNSYQDSPEEFFKHFLQALDDALLSTSGVNSLKNEANPLKRDLRMDIDPQASRNETKNTPHIHIRHLDLQSPSTPASETSNQDSKPERYIDL